MYLTRGRLALAVGLGLHKAMSLLESTFIIRDSRHVSLVQKSTNGYGGNSSRQLTGELESVDVNTNLVAALALYQQRRDTAIGLRHITTKQRYLLWYYNTLQQQEYQALAKVSIAKGVMIEIRSKMAGLKRQLKKAATLEEKQAILIQATELERLAEQAING